jgi:hypothetical protein
MPPRGSRVPAYPGAMLNFIADIAIGIVGALIGSWLLPALHVHPDSESFPPLSVRRLVQSYSFSFFRLFIEEADGETAQRSPVNLCLSDSHEVRGSQALLASSVTLAARTLSLRLYRRIAKAKGLWTPYLSLRGETKELVSKSPDRKSPIWLSAISAFWVC